MTEIVVPHRILDTVSVGDPLPTLVEPVDIVTNFMFGVAFWTAHRIHYDHVAAHDDGFTAPVIPGALMAAYVARVLVDWCGDPRRLRRVSNRNVASSVVDADLTVTGRVTAIERSGDHGLVTCEMRVITDDRLLMESIGIVELDARSAHEVGG